MWAYFFSQANSQLPSIRSLLDLFKNWSQFSISTSGKEIWKRLPASICWNVWLERNARIFTGKKRSVEATIVESKVSAFHWATTIPSMAGYRLNDVISNWRALFFDRP